MADGVIVNHHPSEVDSRTMSSSVASLATVKNSSITTFQRKRSFGAKLALTIPKLLKFFRTIFKEKSKNSHSQKDSWHWKLVI